MQRGHKSKIPFVIWGSSPTANNDINPNQQLFSNTNNKTIQILYAGHPDRYEEYRLHLLRAFSTTSLSIHLSNETNATNNNNPSSYHYIIYSPNGPLHDFSPYTSLRAILSLWAGVETICRNPTLPPPAAVPLTRMVDPGLRRGMVEYVVGHVMRYHLDVDGHWERKRGGSWRQSESGEGMNPLASERIVGILGMGELGGACAAALEMLNFRVVGWSRRAGSSTGGDDVAIRRRYGSDGLDDVLSQSDILVGLLPNTPQTVDLINRETLSRCKRGVFLINAGRGTLINDDDLLDALDEGIVGGATLDVFRQEPLPSNHPYWSHPRVLITPHVAAKTRAETAVDVIVENVRRCEEGVDLLYVVDRNAGY